MVALINSDRMNNGLTPVELGNNPAAQLHADELFEQEFLGHWGLDGLKPYMRYTLAGGLGAESENASGSTDPRFPGVLYAETPVTDSLRKAQEGLMSSPGHRRTILDPWHQKVNLGIACDNVGCSVVQQFEHNYVAFDGIPSFSNGILAFSGRTFEGLVYQNTQIWYDPLPEALQAGQIRETHCYDRGTPVVFIRKPAPIGSYYSTNSSLYTWPNCFHPEVVDPNTLPDEYLYSVRLSGIQPVRPPRFLPNKTGLVSWKSAELYNVQGTEFEVLADMSLYLSQYGRGVYTVAIWGNHDDESVQLTNYSIFVESF